MNSLKILLTGGGTGGHITPILAVAYELKQQQPDCQTVYVGERHGTFNHLTKASKVIDEEYSVFAGKFRRYHGESWLRRVSDLKTNTQNLRDAFYVLFGFFQSIRLLGKIKPDLVFLKGGYVGVPIGLAAAVRRIPIVTHDSDVLPGLANRLVSRWARAHATALAAEYYPYPPQKVWPVGVLVEHNYQAVDDQTQQTFKTRLNLPGEEPLLLVTGGSSGAARINTAVADIIDQLLQTQPSLHVIHQVGQGKAGVYGTYRHDRLEILEFLSPMYVYTGAADLVVCRASANTLAELGVQGKACIAVPNPDLTGGHQLKNAQRLKEQGAAIIVEEDALHDSEQGLLVNIERLLTDKDKRKELGSRLQQLTSSHAAYKLAVLLLEQAKNKTDDTFSQNTQH